MVTRPNMTEALRIGDHVAAPDTSRQDVTPASGGADACEVIRPCRRPSGSSVNQLNIVLLGPPGAGKGTQAARLRADLGLIHLATGDLLREHRAHETPPGREAARYMDAGELVPDELVIAMILHEIENAGIQGFLLDGFPRTLAQAEALEAALGALDRRPAALLIEVPDDALLERISGRRQCPDGHVYHLAFDPPERDGVCDADGKPLSHRDDDEPETVRARLRVYHDETEPLVGYYAERGLLRRVDGSRPPDAVYEQLQAALATLRGAAPS
jgi:adenylate kinase